MGYTLDQIHPLTQYKKKTDKTEKQVDNLRQKESNWNKYKTILLIFLSQLTGLVTKKVRTMEFTPLCIPSNIWVSIMFQTTLSDQI